jgi:hypothetical protein
MAKKIEKTKNMSLGEFRKVYKLPSDFPIFKIPLKSPKKGGKIYYKGTWSWDHWYGKKPSKYGRMFSFGDTFFSVNELEVHDHIKKELGGKAGTFTEKSSIFTRKKKKRMGKYVMHHDDSPCHERLDSDGSCPKCGFHPDMQSKQLWLYCPDCDVPLKSFKCPNCKNIFTKPK